VTAPGERRHQPAADVARETVGAAQKHRAAWSRQGGVGGQRAELTATLASGNGARPNSDILDVTGTAPVTFAEFAAKTAPAWK